MMIKKFLPLLFLFAGFQVNATIIDVPNSTYLGTEGDPLTGAIGVAVDGILYDVTFQDGTCVALFSGCDESSDFAFQTGAAANQASQALMDQVFGGPVFGEGYYDTRGEDGWGYGDFTQVYYVTPHAAVVSSFGTIYLSSSRFLNYDGPIECGTWSENAPCWAVDDNSALQAGNAGLQSNVRFAVWTKSSSLSTSVPEPSIIALFALGLAGLGFARRRQS
jgi:predicted heme/steroid binding protein